MKPIVCGQEQGRRYNCLAKKALPQQCYQNKLEKAYVVSHWSKPVGSSLAVFIEVEEEGVALFHDKIRSQSAIFRKLKIEIERYFWVMQRVCG